MNIFKNTCMIILFISTYTLGMVEGFQIKLPDLTPITALALSPDEQFFAAGLDNGTIYIADIQTIRKQPVDEQTIIALNDQSGVPVTAMAFGNHIVVGYSTGTLSVIDRKGNKVCILQAHSATIYKIVIDGNLLATASGDGTVKIWRMVDMTCIATISVPHVLQSLAIHERRHCVVIPSGYELHVWDFIEGKEIAIFKGAPGFIIDCLVADQTVCALSGDGSISRWNLQTGARHSSVNSHQCLVSLSISPDNLSLIGVSSDGVAFAWDIATGEIIDRTDAEISNVQKAVANGNSVLFCSKNADISLQNIAKYEHTFMFVNELKCPVEHLRFIDKYKSRYFGEKTYAPDGLSRLHLIARDLLSTYCVRFKVQGVSKKLGDISELNRVKEMILTQDIKTGKLVLQVVKKCAEDGFSSSGKTDEKLELKNYYPRLPWKPSLPAERIDVMAYTIGDPIKILTLTDAQGTVMQAQRYSSFNSIWKLSFENTHEPYKLTTQTFDKKTVWDIPYISDRYEFFIMLLPQLSRLMLFMESSGQEYIVKLPEPVSKDAKPV